MKRLALSVIGLLSLAPAGAQAASVVPSSPAMNARVVTVTDAGSEVNKITVSVEGAFVIVRDAGPAPLTSPGDACTANGTQERRCTLPMNWYVREIVADLGGGDDEFTTSVDAPTTVNGQAGRDIMRGTPQADKLSGGLGNDDAYGFAGNDELNDRLDNPFDEDGNDRQDGGAGDDKLVGGSDNDTLLGGPGQDELWVANGIETTNGGSGIDVVAADPFGGGAAPVFEDDYLLSLDGRTNDGFRTSPERWSIGPGIEDLQGTFQDDVLIGDRNVNRIDGQSGADRITPGASPDTVNGGDDADVINAFDGSVDRVLCGLGSDTADLDAGDQHVDCETPRVTVVEPQPLPPGVLPDTAAPLTGLALPRRGARLKNLRRGRVPSLAFTTNEPVSATVTLFARTRTFRLARAGEVELASKRLGRAGGRRSVKLKVKRRLAKRIGRKTKLRVDVTAVDRAGNVARKSYRLKIRR